MHVCIKHTSDATQYTPTTCRKVCMLTFNRANDLLMDTDLETIIDTNDIRLIWSNWKKIFLDIVDECIPTSFFPNRENPRKDIIQLMHKRNNLFKKAKDSNHPNDVQKLKAIQNNKIVSKLRSSS